MFQLKTILAGADPGLTAVTTTSWAPLLFGPPVEAVVAIVPVI